MNKIKGTSWKNKVKSDIYERYSELRSDHLYFCFKPALGTFSMSQTTKDN